MSLTHFQIIPKYVTEKNIFNSYIVVTNNETIISGWKCVFNSSDIKKIDTHCKIKYIYLFAQNLKLIQLKIKKFKIYTAHNA